MREHLPAMAIVDREQPSKQLEGKSPDSQFCVCSSVLQMLKELQAISELALHCPGAGSCSSSQHVLFDPGRNYAQVFLFSLLPP